MSTIARVIAILIAITASASGRSLDYDLTHPSSPPPQSSSYPQLVFFMRDVLGGETSSTSSEADNNSQPVSGDPEGLFPPPSPEADATLPAGDNGGDSADWVSYISNIRGLEVGEITVIDEDLREGRTAESSFLGRARGVYVAVPADSTERMMAMTARFADGDKDDSLRFFGIRQSGSSASHVAVIGGTGRFDGANGYATVTRVDDVDGISAPDFPTEENLQITVILS